MEKYLSKEKIFPYLPNKGRKGGWDVVYEEKTIQYVIIIQCRGNIKMNSFMNTPSVLVPTGWVLYAQTAKGFCK